MLFLKTINYTFLGILCFNLLACNGTKEVGTTSTISGLKESTPNQKVQKLLSFEKGACHGTCPTYEMTIYSDGKAVYTGKRFSDRQGEHSKQLSGDLLKQVEAACASLNFANYPEEYESRIPDFSKNSLIYFANGKAQKTAWRENCADELEVLGKQLSAIADEQTGWTLTKKQTYPASFITNEVIVSLHPKADAKVICKNYREYGLTIKERLMPKQNYWLLSYDTQKIAPYQMLNILNNNEQIFTAEFNKKLENRRN